MSAESTPFERIGGLDGVRALVDRFYDLMEDLPEAAQNYVKRVDELTGVKTVWIGVGPGRDAIVIQP